jgi:thioredoxin reductase (NADPH)
MVELEFKVGKGAVKQSYDLIILGGGPAGLTAGIYAARSRLDTLLIGKLVPGGQAASTEWVENYPGFPSGISGTELIAKMEQQARKFGLEVFTDEVTSVEFTPEKKIVQTTKAQFTSKALIIATGTEPKKLNIPGEDKFKGRGVSYCATCDGPFFKEMDIAVIGCGNSGLQEGLYLLRFVKSITFVEFLPQMPAVRILQERVKGRSNTKFFLNHIATAVNGGNKVESITVKNRETDKEETIPVQGIFIYVGLIPNTRFLQGKLELNQDGYVLTNENTETSVPGVFAAGDVRQKILQQITTAVSDGSIAPFMAEKYIERSREK